MTHPRMTQIATMAKISVCHTWRRSSASLRRVSMSSRLLVVLLSRLSSRRCRSHLGTGELEMTHSEISMSNATPVPPFMLPASAPPPPKYSLCTDAAMLHSVCTYSDTPVLRSCLPLSPHENSHLHSFPAQALGSNNSHALMHQIDLLNPTQLIIIRFKKSDPIDLIA